MLQGPLYPQWWGSVPISSIFNLFVGGPWLDSSIILCQAKYWHVPHLVVIQKHRGSLAQTVSRVQISTMCVKDDLMVAGGFQGELICKVYNMNAFSLEGFDSWTLYSDNSFLFSVSESPWGGLLHENDRWCECHYQCSGNLWDFQVRTVSCIITMILNSILALSNQCFCSGSTHFMTANNDSHVRTFDTEKFALVNRLTFPWSVNVSTPLISFWL